MVNDLNGLDTYTLCTVHEQDSVVARHKRTNYMHTIACVLYIACNVIHAYIAHVLLISVCVRACVCVCVYVCICVLVIITSGMTWTSYD